MVTQTALDPETLAGRAAGGDEVAFARLYEEYSPSLYDFALRTLQRPGAAAEVVRTTFVKAWDSMPHRGHGDFHAWLVAIARTTAVDEPGGRRRALSLAGPQNGAGS